MFSKLPSPLVFLATFMSYEGRGYLLRVDGTAGSSTVIPKNNPTFPMQLGDKVVLNYEVEFQQAEQKKNYNQQAGIRCNLVSIDKFDEKIHGVKGAQANLIPSPENRK